MRFRALVSEAYRDVVSGTSRTVTLWLALTTILLALTIADTATTDQLLSSARRFQASGAATTTLSAAGAIDGSACDALTAVPGIKAAGALRNVDSTLTLAVLPGTPVPMFEVSTTFVRVLDARPTGGGGVYLPDDVLQAIGDTTPPAWIETEQGRTSVAGSYSYPADGRRAGFGWAALLPSAPTKPFDECWVTAWPQVTAINQLLLNTLTPQAGTTIDAASVQISQLNIRLGYSFTGAETYRHRATLLAPLIAALAGLLVAVVGIRLRRVELAARLHDGARHPDLHWMLLLETASWAVPSFLTTVGTGTLTAIHAGPPDEGSLLAATTGTALAGVFGAMLGTVTAMSRIRESLLFRYFKDR